MSLCHYPYELVHKENIYTHILSVVWKVSLIFMHVSTEKKCCSFKTFLDKNHILNFTKPVDTLAIKNTAPQQHTRIIIHTVVWNLSPPTTQPLEQPEVPLHTWWGDAEQARSQVLGKCHAEEHTFNHTDFQDISGCLPPVDGKTLPLYLPLLTIAPSRINLQWIIISYRSKYFQHHFPFWVIL